MAQVDATTFDPYYKWLAIPSHEQPPNFYRLLGIELFEEDADVIAAAADRQMVHIKSFAAGRYASHSQRLLNELAEARICLLNWERKSRYDRQLKHALSSQATNEEEISAQSMSVGASAQAAGIADSPRAVPPIIVDQRATHGRLHRRQKLLIPVMLLLLLAGSCVLLLKTLGVPQGPEKPRFAVQANPKVSDLPQREHSIAPKPRNPIRPKGSQFIRNGQVSTRRAEADARMQNDNHVIAPQTFDAINELREVINANDEAKIISTIQRIRAIDPSCKEIEGLVQEYLTVNDNESIDCILLVLKEVGTNVQWPINFLADLQQRLINPGAELVEGTEFDEGIVPFDDSTIHAGSILAVWFAGARHFEIGKLKHQIRPAQQLREATRMLAEFAKQNEDVQAAFQKRLNTLANDPAPQERIVAALTLSGATALSGEIVPALLESLRNDASIDVRLAAAFGLGGFSGQARDGVATLARMAKSSLSGHHRFVLFVALADIDPNSSYLRRLVGETLQGYRQSNDADDRYTLVPCCNTLALLGSNATWSVTPLLESARLAVAREDLDDLRALTMALARTGGQEPRVLKFYERAAEQGSTELRVYCDMVAKQLNKATTSSLPTTGQ
jgi:hypothetical protein